MRNLMVLAFIPLGFLFAQEVTGQELTNQEKLERINELKSFAFGSCNAEKHRQPLWNHILENKPQLFLWGGDNIYGDTSVPGELWQKYAQQNSVKDYQKLKKNIPIIGTWDDHDYGADNATYANPIKDAAQKMFLDFVEEPLDSIRRAQKGIYTSYSFGPPERRIKIIILDNRYHMLAPEENNDILGNAQWEWLEKELQDSEAKVHFVVGGLSILSYRIRRTEEWADHPRALNRMLNLIRRLNPSGLVFLTGDKHFSSIFQHFGHLEFMSSGMTHTAPWIVRRYVSRFYPITFFGLSYGLVKINWKENRPILQMEIKTTRDRPIFTRVYKLDENNQWQRH